MSTDETLFTLFKSGDWNAFTEIVERYQTVAINYCLRHTGERPTAEDLAQEAFARLFAQRDRLHFDSGGKLRAWLFRVLHNSCIDHNRRYDGFVWVPFEDRLLDDRRSDDRTLHERVEADSALEVLKEDLRLLSPEDREALYLTAIEGMSHTETAEIMGMSVASVKVRLHRARKRLLADGRLAQAMREVFGNEHS